MKGAQMLRGFATISFFADDLKAARAWYTELLGIEPYFQRPDAENSLYIEFRFGDYQHELGIIDRRYAPYGPVTDTAGTVVYLQVDDVDAALARLQSMGGSVLEPRIDREAGFVTASVVDPFGNILGVMENPHYLSVLESMNTA
jgi:predicted enzyme related to lactoylglutathione lyase